jgi:hypothetical protein
MRYGLCHAMFVSWDQQGLEVKVLRDVSSN